MKRWWRCLMAGLVLAACVGCGNQAAKDKNKDQDRPKPAEKS